VVDTEASFRGLCCKFVKQTSLLPGVCRAFLGCQGEKAVDELNLSKKIISCLCLVKTPYPRGINGLVGSSVFGDFGKILAMIVWFRHLVGCAVSAFRAPSMS
jgi:hypothetical protein